MTKEQKAKIDKIDSEAKALTKEIDALTEQRGGLLAQRSEKLKELRAAHREATPSLDLPNSPPGD